MPLSLENAPKFNVEIRGLKSGENVAYLGRKITPQCRRCNAYQTNNVGHKFCAHVGCHIAMANIRRRKLESATALKELLGIESPN